MTPPLIPRDQVARNFSVAPTVLIRYEARGLVRSIRDGEIEGYRPEEIRRLWTILSLQRDLGINLAGVEAVLKLRAHLDEVHQRVRALADELREALEADLEPDPEG